MKIFFRKTVTAFALFIFLFQSSCNNDPLDVDVSDIDVKLDIRHFEEDLFQNKLTDYNAFQNKYPAFLTDYTLGIIGFPYNTAQEAFPQLMLFKNDVNSKKLYDLVHEKYANFKPYEDQLTLAYKYFKYHFPQEKIPTIITYTSNFSFYINPVGDGYIGIALDMHMGSDFKYYDYANIEKYWRKIQIPESIVTNHMLAHANDLFSSKNRGKNFIDEMMYNGKLLYFLDAVTPSVPDHIKIGLTKAEYDWCVKEEKQIWEYFVKMKCLYDTERRNFERFFKEGPFTIAEMVPDKTPSMIGKFAGWMAVRKYMKENSDVSLLQLMNDGNAEAMLQNSGYKP